MNGPMTSDQVRDGGWNQDLFLRKDTVFKRSYAHSKSNKRLKEEMPNCGVGSLAEFLQEVKLKKISLISLSIIY